MKTLEQLESMKDGALLALVKDKTTRAASAHLELGKALVVLDQRREGKGTLKRYVREQTGIDVPDHAFCCAVAFRVYVAGGLVSESVYDATPLRWLLAASSIANAIDKSSMDEDERAGYRRLVADILTARPDGAQAELETIKRAIRAGEAVKSGASGDASGEGEGAGEAQADATPGNVVPILSLDAVVAMVRQAAVCEDVSLLETLSKALPRLVDAVDARLEELAAPARQKAAA